MNFHTLTSSSPPSASGKNPGQSTYRGSRKSLTAYRPRITRRLGIKYWHPFRRVHASGRSATRRTQNVLTGQGRNAPATSLATPARPRRQSSRRSARSGAPHTSITARWRKGHQAGPTPPAAPVRARAHRHLSCVRHGPVRAALGGADRTRTECPARARTDNPAAAAACLDCDAPLETPSSYASGASPSRASASFAEVNTPLTIGSVMPSKR